MVMTLEINEPLQTSQAFLVHWMANTSNAAVDSLRAVLHEVSSHCAHEPCETQLLRIERYKTSIQYFGRNPNRYRISSDALLRRCKKNGSVPAIHPMVDANNIISLATGWPVGCYDLRGLHGKNLRHRLGAPGEIMETLGKGLFDIEGLPILSDNSGPFGSIISDSARSRIQDSSVECLFVLYGFGDSDFGTLSEEIGRVMSLTGFGVLGAPRLVV